MVVAGIVFVYLSAVSGMVIFWLLARKVLPRLLDLSEDATGRLSNGLRAFGFLSAASVATEVANIHFGSEINTNPLFVNLGLAVLSGVLIYVFLDPRHWS